MAADGLATLAAKASPDMVFTSSARIVSFQQQNGFI